MSSFEKLENMKKIMREYITYLLSVFAILLGTIVIAEFFINLRALLLFYNSFLDKNSYRADFDNMTQQMLSRVFFYKESDREKWCCFFDFYKSACGLTSGNNILTLFLALIEIASLKLLSKLYIDSKILVKYGRNIFIAIVFLTFILTPVSCRACFG